MQDDPDRDHHGTSAIRTHEVTTNFELSAVGRRIPVLRLAIRSMPPEVGRKKCPSVLGIPQRYEELRLEATDRVGCRQEVVAHLGGIDDRSLCTRKTHELKLPRDPGTTKDSPRPDHARPTSLPLRREARGRLLLNLGCVPRASSLAAAC